MKMHPMTGKPVRRSAGLTRQIAAIKQQVQKGREHVHGLFFDRLFPQAPKNLRTKALEHHQTAFFRRGDNEILQPSLAFFNLEAGVLITEEERFEQLPLEAAETFSPVLVLESRSHRARFLVNKDGRTIEFKGLTPTRFDPNDLNPNSGQPQGLFVSTSAKAEVVGLDITGGVLSGAAELGDYFEDLEGYAQIYRAARPGQKYFSWMRMDVVFPVYELLAALEGKSAEEFLYESGRRFGEQLRQLHKKGATLHDPFPGEEKTNEPFFSTLHSGNVDPYGNIIDLEGARTFEIAFEDMLANWERLEHSVPARTFNRMRDEINQRKSLERYSRASDLHVFLAGREGRNGSSAFERIFWNGRLPGSPKNFFELLSGILHGYYEVNGEKRQKNIDSELAKILERVERERTLFSFQQTFNIMAGIESGRPF